MSQISVILVAAGSSSRFNHPNDKKTFVMLKSKAVWLHSAEIFLRRPDVKQLIVVVAPEDRADFLVRFGPNIAVLGIDVVEGGRQRADSVANGLQKVDPQSQWVVVHDAARPCWNADLLDSVLQAARKTGAALPAIPVDSTLKRSADGKRVDATEKRDGLYLAQTPQAFSRELIQQAFRDRGDFQPTDEAQLIERLGHEVAIVAGSPLNIKITRRDDLRLAQACLAAMPTARFDAPIHPFADDHLFR